MLHTPEILRYRPARVVDITQVWFSKVPRADSHSVRRGEARRKGITQADIVLLSHQLIRRFLGDVIKPRISDLVAVFLDRPSAQ